MENLPYEDLDELTKIIIDMGYPEAGGKAALKILDQMSGNICAFVKSLMDLISSDRTDDRINKAKRGACIATANYLKKQISQNGLLYNQLVPIMTYILNAVFSPNSSLGVKRHLRTIILSIFQAINSEEAIGTTLSIIDQKIQKMTVDDCSGFFAALEIFVEMPNGLSKTFLTWFQKVKDQVLKITKQVIEKCSKELKQELDPQNPDVDLINRLEEIMCALIFFRKIITQSVKDKQPKAKAKNSDQVTPFQFTAFTDSNTLELFVSALDLQLSSEKHPSKCFISTTGNLKIDQTLDSIKGGIINCFNHILDYTLNSGKGNKTLRSNPFFTYAITTGADKVLCTLFAVCEPSSFDLDNALTGLEFENCLVECMIMAKHLALTIEIYDPFYKFHRRLIVNVCLPLLKTGSMEKEAFHDNPQDFVGLAEDTCNQQVTQTFKSQAALLLETICDNIQGATTFVVIILLQTMEFALFDNNPSNLTSSYPLLLQYKDTRFLQERNPAVIVETALMALAPISYLAVQRADLVQLITRFLENSSSYFLSDTLDPLVRSRMCTFIEFYFEILPENLRPFIMEFLVNSISTYESWPAVSLSAIEGLASIIQDEESVHKFTSYFEELTIKITEQTKVIPSARLYDIIEVLFTIYHNCPIQDTQFINLLLRALVDKLLQIYHDKQNGKDSSNDSEISSNIWRIISNISKDKKYIPEYQEDIEKIMDPLFTLVLNDESAPFGEEILSFVANVAKISGSMSSAGSKMIKVFPRILVKAQGQLGPLLFPAFNQAIISGDKSIYEDSGFVTSLVELGVQGLKNDSEDPMIAVEFALLLQLVLQYLSISNDDWERILVASYDLLTKTENSKQKAKLGGVLLSGFIYNFSLTLQIVEKYNMEDKLLSLYIDDCIIFEHQYDRKLLVIGLCSMLAQGVSNSTISQRFVQILRVTACILKYTTLMAAINKKDDDDDENGLEDKDLLKELLKNFLPEMEAQNKNKKGAEADEDEGGDDDDFEDEDKDKDDKEKDEDDDDDYIGITFDNIELLMNAFESEINKRDEFMAFMEAVRKLRKDNKEFWQQTIKNLQEKDKRLVKEALCTQRVVVNTRDGKLQTKPRKIAKVKGIKIYPC